MSKQAFINTREEGAVWFLGSRTLIRSGGEASDGAFGLVEQVSMPPGYATPYHRHLREDEAFYILEGEVKFHVDGQWIHAKAGDYVYGPRGIPHGFRVVGEQSASMLVICSPSGFEKFVLALSQPLTDPSTPPAPPAMERLLAVAQQFEIEILGPLPE